MKVKRKGDNQPAKKMMGGGMMYNKGGTPKKTIKKKKLAAMYPPKDKITRGDIIAAAKMKSMKKPKRKK